MSETSVVVVTSRAPRTALIVGGLVAALFGIAILVWPTKAAVAVTALIASWALVVGVTYVVMSLFAKEMGAGSRIGHILLGILYVVAGIFAFAELHRSAAFLAMFAAVLVGILWIIEGFTSLFTLGGSGGSTALTILFAIISVIAGVTLVTSPLWGAVFLWWFLGVALLVLGIINFVRGITAPRVGRG